MIGTTPKGKKDKVQKKKSKEGTMDQSIDGKDVSSSFQKKKKKIDTTPNKTGKFQKKTFKESTMDQNIDGMDVSGFDDSFSGKRQFNDEDSTVSPSSKRMRKFSSGSKPSNHGKNGKNSDSQGKPNWKTVKEERKALREKRRAAQRNADSYEVSMQAKKVLESIRSRKCPREEQIAQLQKLHLLLKGKLLSVVYAHDMSRVVETMVKMAHSHKETAMLKEMVLELLAEVKEMSKRKYATHVVRAIISHCQPEERKEIVSAFKGQVLKMLNHKVGNGVIELLYSKAKQEEKHILQKELYGPSYKLVTSEPVTGLDVIFRTIPTMKESTLTNTKEILDGLFEKNIVESHIMHTTLLDYLGHSAPEDSASMMELARNHIKALSKTKEGVHVAMMCTWMAGPKARKLIVKSLKGGIATLACGEHTHLLLLAVFDAVDDTMLLNKVVLSELLSGDLSVLLSNTYGRKVLMYLCSRRDPVMFTAPVVAALSAGDSNPHSKKDADIRASELRDFTVPVLLRHIVENTPLWMGHNSNLLVLLAALKGGAGENLLSALKAVAKHVVNPTGNSGKADLSVVDNTGCHMMLKKLAQHDQVFLQKNEETFGAALIEELQDKHYAAWLGNNHCCFLLLHVLKNGATNVVETLQRKIKEHSSKVWKKDTNIPLGGQKLREIVSGCA